MNYLWKYVCNLIEDEIISMVFFIRKLLSVGRYNNTYIDSSLSGLRT